ncbi:MAG: cobalamin biosynthesis protein [Ancalomicrobiaceae bacterium]|nr:cobalamin biosynthesis protein [Ancalomicrobiaceae bacterium]
MSDLTRIAPGLMAIGIGCRRGATEEAVVGIVEKAIGRAFDETGQQGRAALFTAAAKRNETGLAAAAIRLHMPLVFLPEEALKAMSDGAVTRSERVVQLFGVPSIAETAALAGAGKGARLIVTRIAGDGVTCAIAAHDERDVAS